MTINKTKSSIQIRKCKEIEEKNFNVNAKGIA
jgi:hypothetical protein